MRAPPLPPTTRGLQSWCYAVAMREDPVVAVAGLVVGLESQVPSIYRKQTPTLREKYGFTDEEVEFFDLHIVSDEIHGERGYQIVLEHADTPEQYSGLPSNPTISPLVSLWKGAAKPLAVAAMLGAVVAGFFHYMKVGPIEEKEEERS